MKAMTNSEPVDPETQEILYKMEALYWIEDGGMSNLYCLGHVDKVKFADAANLEYGDLPGWERLEEKDVLWGYTRTFDVDPKHRNPDAETETLFRTKFLAGWKKCTFVNL